jgi:hypothetical protein
MRYELWRHEDAQVTSESFIPVDEKYDDRRRAIHPEAKLIWTIDAENYDEAFTFLRRYLRTSPQHIQRGFFVDSD